MFKGTPQEKDDQLEDYFNESFDTLHSRGELKFRIEYRGYKVKCDDQFQDPVDEVAGPVWEPTHFDDPPNPKLQPDVTDYYPNWIRSQQTPRRKYKWLDHEPAVWGAFEPSWSYVKELSLSWGTWSKDGFGSYRLTDGNSPVVEKHFSLPNKYTG